MEGSKVVKAFCRKTGDYYSLEVIQVGREWKVVDFAPLPKEKARLFSSEVKQRVFETNNSLLPCQYCHSRVVGGCRCVEKKTQCAAGMPYQFNCIYCHQMTIDYSDAVPSSAGGKIELPQGKVVEITFRNVEWKRFDNVRSHEAAPSEYHEPRVHVLTSETDIEFHGYNVSEMDEGVYYNIGCQDDFSIECDVDTSKISPHPGGHLYINLGIITAEITQYGGDFLLNGERVAHVGSRFHMRLAVTDGCHYSIELDGSQASTATAYTEHDISIVFGFTHESHFCEQLSHAFIRGIRMNQKRM